MAAKGNDNCAQDVIPAKAMELSADDVKAYDEISALDPQGRTTATT